VYCSLIARCLRCWNRRCMVLRVRVGVRLGHVYGDRKVESFDIVRVVHRYRTFSFSIGLLSLDLMEVDPGIEQVRSSSRTGGCVATSILRRSRYKDVMDFQSMAMRSHVLMIWYSVQDIDEMLRSELRPAEVDMLWSREVLVDRYSIHVPNGGSNDHVVLTDYRPLIPRQHSDKLSSAILRSSG
jgi:hypothetical protein